MKIEIKQTHLVILFAILFVSVGWIAPAAYASYAPQEHYIEVNEFSASNATTSDDGHVLCFDRNVKKGGTATLYTELYLITDDDTRTEVDSRTVETYFEKGDIAVKVPFELPIHIEAGNYRYVLVIQMELAQGRVTREFVFESEPFTIAEGNEMNDKKINTFNC